MGWILRTALTTALVAAMPPGLAQAAQSLPLEPVSPWNVHYAEDSCMLIRSFGEGKQQVTARFEQTAPGRSFSLTLLGDPVRAEGPFTRAALTFQPVGQRDRYERAAAGTAGEAKRPMLMFSNVVLLGPRGESDALVDSYDWSRVGEIDSLLIERGAKDIILKLGTMRKPLEAMNACTDELLTHWGLDASAQRTLRQGPKPVNAPGHWLESNDYPSGALLKGSSAIVHFRLTVDAQGKVIGCAIPSATQGPEFAKVTCQAIARRARFEPALDKDGKPIASYFVSSVTWKFG